MDDIEGNLALPPSLDMDLRSATSFSSVLNRMLRFSSDSLNPCYRRERERERESVCVCVCERLKMSGQKLGKCMLHRYMYMYKHN